MEAVGIEEVVLREEETPAAAAMVAVKAVATVVEVKGRVEVMEERWVATKEGETAVAMAGVTVVATVVVMEAAAKAAV